MDFGHRLPPPAFRIADLTCIIKTEFKSALLRMILSSVLVENRYFVLVKQAFDVLKVKKKLASFRREWRIETY